MKIESLKKRQRRYVVKTEKQRGMRDMTIPVIPGASQAEYIRRFEELNHLRPA